MTQGNRLTCGCAENKLVFGAPQTAGERCEVCGFSRHVRVLKEELSILPPSTLQPPKLWRSLFVASLVTYYKSLILVEAIRITYLVFIADKSIVVVKSKANAAHLVIYPVTPVV